MHDVISNKLESFYNLLQTTKESLSDENKFQKIQTLQEQTKKLHFQKTQKEFQSSLLKLGKEIDKKFKQDVSVIYQPDAFSNKQEVIQNTLAVHFIRQGQFKLCEDFLNEAGIPIDSELRDAVEKLKNDIEQMHTILNQIETDQDLTLAIEWAKANREGLMKMQSSLEFSLHKMKFIQILLFKTPLEAIQYGRQHFGAFSEKRYNAIFVHNRTG